MRSRSRRRPRSVGRESAGRSFSRETFILRDAGDVRRRGKKHRTRQYNNVLPSPCGHRPQAGTETLRTRTGRSRCLPEHKMPWVSREVCSSPLWVSISRSTLMARSCGKMHQIYFGRECRRELPIHGEVKATTELPLFDCKCSVGLAIPIWSGTT